jgi:hypothetical protein
LVALGLVAVTSICPPQSLADPEDDEKNAPTTPAKINNQQAINLLENLQRGSFLDAKELESLAYHLRHLKAADQDILDKYFSLAPQKSASTQSQIFSLDRELANNPNTADLLLRSLAETQGQKPKRSKTQNSARDRFNNSAATALSTLLIADKGDIIKTLDRDKIIPKLDQQINRGFPSSLVGQILWDRRLGPMQWERLADEFPNTKWTKRDVSGYSPLSIAVYSGHTPILLEKLIEENEVNFRTCTNDSTANSAEVILKELGNYTHYESPVAGEVTKSIHEIRAAHEDAIRNSLIRISRWVSNAQILEDLGGQAPIQLGMYNRLRQVLESQPNLLAGWCPRRFLEEFDPSTLYILEARKTLASGVPQTDGPKEHSKTKDHPEKEIRSEDACQFTNKLRDSILSVAPGILNSQNVFKKITSIWSYKSQYTVRFQSQLGVLDSNSVQLISFPKSDLKTTKEQNRFIRCFAETLQSELQRRRNLESRSHNRALPSATR